MLKRTPHLIFSLVLSINCLVAQEFDHNFGPGINKPFVDTLDYTTPVGLEFDEFNRPYVMNNVLSPDKTSDDIYRVWTLRNGLWTSFSYQDELEASLGASKSLDFNMTDGDLFTFSRQTDMVIDGHNNLYAYVIAKVLDASTGVSTREWKLVYAKDVASPAFNGDFKIYSLPDGVRFVELEVRTSTNDFSLHPPVLAYTDNRIGNPYPSGPSYMYDEWADFNVVDIDWENDQEDLDMSNVIMVSDSAGRIANHSGGQSFAVTKGDYTYFTWLRHTSDPADDPNGNSEAWINVLDRNTGTLGPNIKVQTNEERANSHNQPVMAIDASGYIHLQGGAHSRTGFLYSKSTNPLDLSSWSTPVEIFDSQTYSTLLIDNLGNMYSPFRGDGPMTYYSLYFNKGDVINGFANQDITLFADNTSCNVNYRNYHHTIHKDRPTAGNNDRIYMSWGANCESGPSNYDLYRVLAFSDDQGSTWTIPTRYDFLERADEGKSVQKITFDPITTTPTVEVPFTVSATSTAGLPITYSIVSGDATISGNTITPTGEGEIVISASNNGDLTYYGDLVTTTVIVNPGAQSVEILSPEADAYVRNGTYADNNYGSHEHLRVKLDGSNHTRESYLRFDLSSVQGTIISATLELTPDNNPSPGAGDFEVKFVSDDSWTESGITWNNRPAGSTLLDSKTSTISPMEWDITTQAETERTGDGKLSVKLEATVSGNTNVWFYSDDEVVVSVRPRLILTVQPSEVLAPEADAFVRNGSYANNNYGSSASLTVKLDGNNYTRESFLRFDLSSIPGTITNATLELTPLNVPAPGATDIEVSYVADDTWTESGITWNNKPSGSTLLDGQPSSASVMTWDVTTQAESERAGDGKLSVKLESTVLGGSFHVTYNSKEATDQSVLPRLIVQYSPSAGARISSGDMVLSVEEELVSSLSVYPNPVTDFLTVESDHKITQWAIYDFSGREVTSQSVVNDKNLKIKTSSLAKGIYVLKITDETGAQLERKFVK